MPSTPKGSPSATPVPIAPSQGRLAGRLLGKCRLLKRLGRGGMGDVYLAEHQLLERKVAVKILPPDLIRNADLLERFHREAIAAARLEHPNIVHIYDVGQQDDLHYIVMQYIEGKNIEDMLIESVRLEPREAARVAMEAARGLQAAHDGGIVHRDIKPANILLSSKHEVKIVDFGLAFDTDSRSSLTVAGTIMGTPQYLSPEQAQGKRSDERSDIYSLGVCLYTMVTGQRPFTGESPMSIIYKQINEKPQNPVELVPTLPPALANIILKTLEKRPEARYAKASDLAAALDRFINGPARKPAAAKPVVERRRPAFSAWSFALGAASMAVMLLGAYFWPKSDPEPVAAKPVVKELTADHLKKMLGEETRREIAGRDYDHVIGRLQALQDRPGSPAAHEAVTKLLAKLESARKVVSAYSAAAGKPAASATSETVAATARKGGKIAPMDLANFFFLDGDARGALDEIVALAEESTPADKSLEKAVDPTAAQLDAVEKSRRTAARFLREGRVEEAYQTLREAAAGSDAAAQDLYPLILGKSWKAAFNGRSVGDWDFLGPAPALAKPIQVAGEAVVVETPEAEVVFHPREPQKLQGLLAEFKVSTIKGPGGAGIAWSWKNADNYRTVSVEGDRVFVIAVEKGRSKVLSETPLAGSADRWVKLAVVVADGLFLAYADGVPVYRSKAPEDALGHEAGLRVDRATARFRSVLALAAQ